jgi:plastocyanin
MKRFIGLCILVILLVAASGCTQQAAPAAATPVPTTIAATAVPTPQVTVPPATVETTVVTTTAATPAVTTVVTTAATAKPVLTPQITQITFYFRNNTITPQELTVLPGTGITWINEDSTVHAIKMIGNHEGMFNSGDIIPGATWGYSFGANEGRFEFKDTYSNSTGVVIVRKGESLVGAPTMQTPTPAKA